MRYVMSRILGTDGGSKHLRSPGVYCTSLGRLGGDKVEVTAAPCAAAAGTKPSLC